jgi:uncharacterized membrane protein
MKCLKCGRENESYANYCIYCGSPMPPAIPEDEQKTLPVHEEINQLRQLVSQITKRLDNLESQIKTAEAPIPEVSPPLREAEPEPEPVPQTPVISEEAPAVAEMPPPPSPPEPKVKKEREWEQILGGSWLARIGVIALIIGAGFFLKYAFDNQWLGPAGRVTLGAVAGLIMVGLAFYWRKKYPILTQVLTGGGIAILYLSIFASFSIYALVNIYIAIFCLFIVSIASAILAIYYNSMALAIIGIFGAFFAPFILGAFGDRESITANQSQGIQLLAYIIVVDIGVLILANFRNWRWFTLLALVCSLITYGAWYAEFNDTAGIATAEVGITIIFLIFVGVTSLYHFVWRRAPEAFDFSLMLINAAAYFGISLGIMWDSFRGWMGGFVFVLALFYGVIAFIALTRQAKTARLSLFLIGIALIFLSVAIPIQLGDKAWTTVAWAAEAAVLIWLSFRANIPIFRIFSYIVSFAVIIRLIAFDTFVDTENFRPVFNERFLAFIFSIAATCLMTYLFWKNRGEKFEKNYLIFLGATNILILWIVAAEVFTYSQQPMTTTNSVSLIIPLIMITATILYPVFWRRDPTRLDSVINQINPVAFIIITVFIWDDLRAWIGSAYFLLAICYGILVYKATLKKSMISSIGPFSILLAVAFFTAAIAIQLENTVWTTIVWAVEFVILIQLSFTFRMSQLRNYSYVVFLAMAARLLIFDTPVEIGAFKPVINERFLAFVIGIAATYLGIYLHWRKRNEFPELRTPISTLVVGVNFLTIWILSFEVWQSFSVALRDAEYAAREGLKDAQNLSLTAVWAIYAIAGLVVGIAKRWRYVRIGALGLLAIPIVKVFVYDVFQLELGYRIGAFVGLGVLLLTSAYLYQRYSRVIKGVFTENNSK